MDIKINHPIKEWIDSLEPSTLLRVWNVIKILKIKSDETGERTFLTPFNIFQEQGLDKNETEEILMNLHHQGLIDVIREKSTPPSSKIKFSVEGVSDNTRLYEPLFTSVFNKFQVKLSISSQEDQLLPTKVSDDIKEVIYKLSSKPERKRYKAIIKILNLFLDKNVMVKNHLFAAAINPTTPNTRYKVKKFTQGDYSYKRKKYDQQIQNRFKTINKYFKNYNYGYSLSFGAQASKLIFD